MKYQMTLVSGNRKTGPIPTTMTERKSCSPTCPFLKKCYGEGWPLNLHWNNVETKGIELDALTQKIKKLPRAQMWRHNVTGDLDHVGGFINRGTLEALTEANKGKRGYTYTHHALEKGGNLDAIKKANANGFTVNASCESVSQASAAIDKGIPAVCVVDKNEKRKTWKESGKVVVLCPATYREDINCATCGACANAGRKSVIAFPAHGNKKNLISEIVKEKSK